MKKFNGKVKGKIVEAKFAAAGKVARVSKTTGGNVKQWDLVASLDRKILQTELDKQLADFEKVRADFEIFAGKIGEPKDDVNKYLKTEKQAQLIIKINTFKPDLLFVSMSTPKQEIWVDIHREELNAIGVFCVGAGLDFYAGTAKAPHRWMEKLEIEWLWRLLTEPKRFKRILNAVVVFPLTLLLNRFKKN